ncbi:hypothetical protein MMC10_009245 [Thelotrema lepadinum]|nr:hypothetical protein [Thelotrema lepadinum]
MIRSPLGKYLSNWPKSSRKGVHFTLNTRHNSHAGFRSFSASCARSETSQRITGGQPPNSDNAAPQNTAPLPKKRASRRYWRISLYSLGFLTLGLASGSFVTAILIPPPVPDPDTEESEELLSGLRKDLGELPIVKELRSRREDWLEYEAYMSQAPQIKASSMTAGAMRGYGGLALQRVFYNRKEKRLISIVFFGGSLVGWPGVVHGGAIASVLLENLERVINGPKFGSGSGSAGTTILEVKFTYQRPTRANALYVVKAEAEEGTSEPGSDSTHTKVKATVEHALTGQACARASGSCATKT